MKKMITRTRRQQPQHRDLTTMMTGQPTKQITMAKISTMAQEHEDDGTTQVITQHTSTQQPIS